MTDPASDRIKVRDSSGQVLDIARQARPFFPDHTPVDEPAADTARTDKKKES